MKGSKIRRETTIAAVFSLTYLLLKIFHYHLDRFFQGVSFSIVTTIAFLFVLMLFGRQIYKIFNRRKRSRGRIKLRFVYYVPAIILIIPILYTISPVKIDSEKFESKVVLQGCYESGNNQARIRLRANDSFEIKWTVEAGTDDWYFGTYKLSRDTIFLTYVDRFPDKFGSVIINRGQTLTSLDRPGGNENYFIQFYIGNCRESELK